MNIVKEIEEAVVRLSTSELADFSSWFANYEANQWDEKIDTDLTNGGFNAAAEEALLEFQNGKTRSL